MAELKAQCEDAWKWLNIEVSAWARYAITCKTDLVVNNLSEVFNKMILDVRSKPIRTMFEGIRTKQMIKRQQTREKLQACRWTITPNYSEILEENKKYAKYCQADRAGETIWQVTSKEKQYCVDMATCTCECKRWNMTGVPCSHGISAMTKQKLHPEDYVSEFFKKPLYMETYKAIIYPIPGPDCWPDTNTQDIHPPVFKEKAGKKQTTRRKGEFEVPAPRDTSRMGTVTCGNCGLEGHRYTTCNKTLKPSLQMRKNKHQENRAVYSDIPAARTTSVPIARGRRGAQASCRHATSQPGPSTSAPGPTTRAKRGRTEGGGRTHGFTTPRAATTSNIQVGTKRKRTPSSK
uniref:SWIM-type domain-containing protein n=1 Tax=Triticum urartu TaxID=4572 RepID=A0A8R7TD71_TRIUA